MMRVPVGWASNNLPRTVCFVFFGGIFSYVGLPVARAQSPSATPQTPQAPPADTSQNAPKPDAKASNDEIVSHDSPATFKVRVNLVLVRVVVRDNNGKVVTNLKKEDFQLADNRKPQIISSFSVETPASHVSAMKMDSPEAIPEGAPVKRRICRKGSSRYTSTIFISRTGRHVFAAGRLEALCGHGGSATASAIFTTSGEVKQDFTGTEGNSRRRSSESCRIHSRRALPRIVRR